MKAVILTGGIGSQMRSLTYVIPKAMLPIGGKPLLEHTIRYLKGYGFREFVVCVAYLKNHIMEYFKNGERLNGYFEEAYWTEVGTVTDFERVDKELFTKFYKESSESPPRALALLRTQHKPNINVKNASLRVIHNKPASVRLWNLKICPNVRPRCLFKLLLSPANQQRSDESK